MPQLPHLQGYRRLPGSARQYLTPHGRTISRYEYDSRRARRYGFANRGELERFRASRDWEHWAFKIAEQEDRPVGAMVTPRIGDWQLIADARDVDAARAGLGDSDVLTDPDGSLHRLLVATGRRDENDTWPVGETPAGVTR